LTATFDHTTNNNSAEYVILTADQVVTCQDQILEKPDSLTQAKEFVTLYGKHPCTTVGCVVLQHYPSQVRVYRHHTASIYFASTLTAPAASQLVDALVADQAPVMQCAGGLMIEHFLTQQYVDRVEGSQDSVMGLDKESVTGLLHELRQQLNERSSSSHHHPVNEQQ
jgi:septum formation protein